jgi:23S rRNA pseudouridine1911/1915/1917 synthase
MQPVQNTGCATEGIFCKRFDCEVELQGKPLDVIRVMLTHPPYENHIVPENIPLNIVYEDDTLLLINKQPGGCSSRSWKLYRTLVHALAYHFDNLPMNSSERPTSASY